MANTESITVISILAKIRWPLAMIGAGLILTLVPHLVWRDGQRVPDPLTIAPLVGMPGAPTTSNEGLKQRINDMERRLQERPGDSAAAVLLADALLRQARVTGSGRLTNRAGDVLRAVLKENPGHYDALRMLGAIDLSQHRFREALDVGQRARDQRPGDAWNYGIMGDALIELGDYDKAFDAFDKMVTMRPSAAAYARVAYARELQGNLEGALQAMQMAGEATTGHDPEAQAWYAAQAGELYLKMRRIDEAEREYRRSAFIFSEYPFAVIGLGKVKAARGDINGALSIYAEQLKRTPTLDLAARMGDLYAERGDNAEAEQYYRFAEQVAGAVPVQTEANFALFLAEHGRKLPEAVKMAETVAATRHDIFTEDALAWAYYKTGRLQAALEASQSALRTGVRDQRILAHAAEIRRAAGRVRSSDS